MWNWSAASRDELHRHLKAIPSDVPPRSLGRTTLHVETWVLRDLLWTLANVTSLLAYPLAVKKGEAPDLDLLIPSGPIGIEVTEATPQRYAHAVAIQNQKAPNAILDPSLFDYASRALSSKEIICRHLLPEGKENQRLTGPGWLGEAPEQEWAARMREAVLSKTENLNDPTYRRQGWNWLAIYDNTPRPALELAAASRYLGERLSVPSGWDVNFDRVFVELSQDLVMFAAGDVYCLRLYRP